MAGGGPWAVEALEEIAWDGGVSDDGMDEMDGAELRQDGRELYTHLPRSHENRIGSKRCWWWRDSARYSISGRLRLICLPHEMLPFVWPHGISITYA